MQPALAGDEALVELRGAHFGKVVDHGVGVRAEREVAPASANARAAPTPSARSRSVVGQRHAVAPALRARRSSSADVWVKWTALKRSLRAPASTRTPVGDRPCAASIASFSAGCSETWACSGTAWSLGPGGNGGAGRRVDGAHAVDRGTGARVSPEAAERVDPLGPGVGVAVGEAALRTFGRRAIATLEVARIEQRDPDPGIGRGLRPARAPSRSGRRRGCRRPVVEIVELANSGDPGERHLGEHRPGERRVAVGIERFGELVHLLAPRPERPALALRPCPGAPDGRRVSARCRTPAGSALAGPSRRVAARATPASTDSKRSPSILGEHSGLGALPAKPCQLAPVGGHWPYRSTISRARCSNSSRWKRS